MNTSQHPDPASLITALYVLVDDLYQERFASHKPGRPGPRPRFSDSEVLTLVILAQWRGDRSERGFLAYARAHLASFFPHLPSQSVFNRRARDLMGVLCRLGPALSRLAPQVLGLAPASYEVLDGVPVPLMRRCRGIQHRLFGCEAAIGRGGSDKEWYYGLKLIAAIDSHGFVSGFLAGPANTEERWLAEALLRWRLFLGLPPPTGPELTRILGPTHRAGGGRKGPTGPLGPRPAVGTAPAVPAIADLNYAGGAWEQHWRDHYGAVVLNEACYRAWTEPQRRRAARWFHGLRQTVETAFSQLVARFGLKFPRARTLWGLHTRLAAKVAAYNFSLYLNHLFGLPTFSGCDPLA